MTIINSGLTTPNTSLNNGKKMVVDSNGIMYACYISTISSFNQITVMKSIDNGVNWINMGFPQIAGYHQQYPSIALDHNNKVYVVWNGTDVSSPTYNQIKYSNTISGTWSTWVNILTITGYHQQVPSITIDTNNKVYVTWSGNDSGNPTYYQIKYSNTISGAWSLWTNIQIIAGYHQQYSSITIDSNNKLHVVWHGTDSSNMTYNQIKYSNNTNGTWSTWINIQPITSYYQYNPNVAIDSNNKLHVVWHGTDATYPAYNQIKYSNNISGTWSAWINIQPITNCHQYYPNVVIPNNNKVHIAWQGTDASSPTYYQIKYSNNVTGTWSTFVNKTSVTTYSYGYPSIIYYNKNVYCIYSGNTTVELFSQFAAIIRYLIQDSSSTIYNIQPNFNQVIGQNIIAESMFLTYGANDLTQLLTLNTLNTSVGTNMGALGAGQYFSIPIYSDFISVNNITIQ